MGLFVIAVNVLTTVVLEGTDVAVDVGVFSMIFFCNIVGVEQCVLLSICLVCRVSFSFTM